MSVETGGVPIESATSSAPQTETVGVAETGSIPIEVAAEKSEDKTADQSEKVRTIVIEPPKSLIGSYRPTGDGLSEFVSMLFESADAMASIVHLGTAVTEQATSSVIKSAAGQAETNVNADLGRGTV